MHNGDGKTLPLCLYPIKYLNESLPYDFLSDNFILSVSPSLILVGLILLWKALFMMPFFSEANSFLFHFYTIKRKKVKIFIFIF